MRFFWKLFKALNSAQNPWQVTLAITLGMIAGLTPLSGIQTVVIIFFALIINIHFGLFVVASALFGGIGYVMDPLFESIGYALLTNDALGGLWTAMYNNGLMRLTYFNNTLVMGSTVFVLIAAVPLYWLAGWIIRRYRTALSGVLEKYPKLGLMGILKAEQKKDRSLRIWGVGVFAVLGGVIGFILIVLLDPLIKWGIEKGASTALQRDVRIGDVDVSVGEGSITIDRMEVAGSKEGIDALSVDKILVDIDLNALLFQRTHVENILIQGMGFDTKATLEKEVAVVTEQDKASSAAKEGASQTKGTALPSIALPTPDDVLNNADLKSQKVAENAKKEIEAIKAKWEKAVQEDLSDKAFESLKNDFEALKQNAKSKDPAKLLALKDDVKAFKNKVKQQKEQLNSLKEDFQKDQNRIKSLITEVKKASSEDAAKLKKTYTLDGSGSLNLIGTIFGGKVQEYLQTAKKYYAMAEPYMKSGDASKKDAEAVSPPRGEGRWIKFASTMPTPDLLIKKSSVDGTLKSQKFAGTVLNITDEQKKVGKPTTFVFTSDGDVIKKLKIDGEDNRLGKQPKDTVRFSATEYPVNQLAMSGLNVEKASVAFDGNVVIDNASALAGTMNANVTKAKLAMAGGSKSVTSVLESVNAFEVKVKLGGTLDKPEADVDTDLDKQLSAALKKSMEKEVKQYQAQLQEKLDGQLKDQLGGLNSDASSIPKIDQLAGAKSTQLDGLNADQLLKNGGGLKNLLPF